MAFFGSKNKAEASPLKIVRPIVVRTQHVAKEMMRVAKSYKINVAQLDFNLLSVHTYSKVLDIDKEAEWEELPQEKLYELDDKTALLNPYFQIKQTYEIEIFPLTKERYNPFPELKVAVGANATKCKIYLSIGAGSIIQYKPTIAEDLLTLIHKKKIRAGILIYIFDEMVKDVVSKISAEVRVQNQLKYEKSRTLLIAEGFEPTPTVDDKIILHFQEKKEQDEKEKIDYASRGFIQSVKKDELLIEYIKPQLGTPGRDCRGEYIEPKAPLIKNKPSFDIDATIRIEESETSIEYRANENGYIAFEDNIYTIKSDMDVKEITFKSTGSIHSGVNSDVTLNVKEKDLVKDAVGSGMDVEVTEIEIDGNVGSNANVKAKRATVGGQTHKSAVMSADDLNINVHKGKAFGKKVLITRLEHGEVHAQRAEISQAVGGLIYANEIKIGLCASHVKAIASDLIEIDKLQGSENIFTIDPLLDGKIEDAYTENQKKIKSLTHELEALQKEIEKSQNVIEVETPAFLDIKKRLLHYKKNGVKLPASFVRKYKEFTQKQEHLKKSREGYALKSSQISLLVAESASFQRKIFDARVINRGRWVGYNEIKFKLLDPPTELVYKPKEGSSEKIFGLVAIEDGEFVIKAVEE